MLFYNVDQSTLLLALALLIGLCLLTLEALRREKPNRPTYPNYLFAGRSPLHGVASNVGALFSLTYFMGAAFIYGNRFGWLFIAASGFVLAILLIVIPLLIGRLSSIVKAPDTQSSNVLLEALATKLSCVNFRASLRLYTGIYFLLLVEELAIARIAFTTILPVSPAVTSLILSTIVLFVFAYLYVGGFRAVLTSDAVQVIPILLFLAVLLVDLSDRKIEMTPAPSLAHGGFSFGFVVLFGVAWFVGGVDYYSRLNFCRQPTSDGETRSAGLKARQLFAMGSLLAIFLTLLIGIIYGASLSGSISHAQSPTQYTEAVVSHFLQSEWLPLRVGFLVAVMCMIFTTVDTLLLTLLQVGYYTGAISESKPMIGRHNLAGVLLAAVVSSTLLSLDATSAFGIFAGSLMMIPMPVIAMAALPSLARWLPRRVVVYELAAVASFLLFIAMYDDLSADFTDHFMIPGLVLITVLLATACGVIADYLEDRIRR